MEFELLDPLVHGLSVATQGPVFFWLLVGCVLGLLVGVLPGLGPAPAMALLLPFVATLPPMAALVMLAAVYYGAQYGGSASAVWANVPGESSSAMSCHDGHPLAQQGRARLALNVATGASFVAGLCGVLLLALASPVLVALSYHFGPAEYVSLYVLGLLGACVLASGGFVKAVAMVLLGSLLGLSGVDSHTGVTRFVGEWPHWQDGLGFVPMALGLLAVAPTIACLAEYKPLVLAPREQPGAPWPSRDELRNVAPAVLRGTAIGIVLGVFPGGGALLASLVAYSVEKSVSREAAPPLGQGHLRGLAAPEAANNAGAQAAFIPTLALGLPANAIMALLLGVLVLHRIEPGPQLMGLQPDLYWGLVMSMLLGNGVLLLLNLPLARLWPHVLGWPPARWLPAVLLALGMTYFASTHGAWAVWTAAAFGLLGHLLHQLRCQASLVVLGFVLAPWIEAHLRRALLLARGDWTVFATRPISAALLFVALVLLLVVLLPTRRKPQGQALTRE